MEIAEAREMRRELAFKIRALCAEFHAKTGLRVEDIVVLHTTEINGDKKVSEVRIGVSL